MQEQAEGVGQKAVTAQAVGAEAVLELLDAILTFAAIVVESEDLRGATGAVSNHEAQVGSGGGVLGLCSRCGSGAANCGPGGESWKSCAAGVGYDDSDVLTTSAGARLDA